MFRSQNQGIFPFRSQNQDIFWFRSQNQDIFWFSSQNQDILLFRSQNQDILLFRSQNQDQEDELTIPRAAMNKMIKEILPNIRVANEVLLLDMRNAQVTFIEKLQLKIIKFQNS